MSFLNILTILILYVLLEAPIIALVGFVVMILLFAGAIQMIRSMGSECFYTRRSLSFSQLLGLILAFLLGALVLLHVSSIVEELPAASAFLPIHIKLNMEGMTLLGLTGLLILTTFISFRLLLKFSKRGMS